MRTIILALFLSSFISIALELPLNAQSTGYFSIKDKTFYDPDGNEFYPLVLNYSCEMACDPNNVNPAASLTDFFISPIPGYGSTDVIECTSTVDCIQNKIHNDFLKIRSMGFNTIRLNGVGFYKNDDQSTGGVFHYGWDGSTGKKREWPILPPYSSSTDAAQYIFNLLGLVMQEAESCTLAVILDETENGFTVHKSVDWNLYINDYIQYAKEKAEYFKAYRNLLAYIFIEEPPHDGFSKMEICDFTTDLYNAVKQEDPYHLITYGGGLEDVYAWDPSVVKVDFYSPHCYADWDMLDAPYTDLNITNLRMKGMLYYFNQTSPLPWILGEIGFSAIDDDYAYLDPSGQYMMNATPHVNGNVFEQRDFVNNSLDWTRDCGVSGYSWWNYQENRWSSPIQDGYGLLRHEDNVFSTTVDKPAADANSRFRSYLNNNIAPLPIQNLCTEPINFHDPYNLETNIQSQNNPNSVEGYLLDMNGNQVINALVGYWIEEFFPDPNDPNATTADLKYRYSFTDQNGYFILNPYILQQPNLLSYDLSNIKISCVGCDVLSMGKWNGASGPPYFSNSLGNVNIATNPFPIEKTFSGFNITQGVSLNLHGWLSVNAFDITIMSGAESNITARDLINVKSELFSANGSELHIYTSDDCSEFANYHAARIASDINSIYSKFMIELNFNKNDSVWIFPNPTHDKFSIHTKEGSKVKNLQIRGIFGQLVFEKTSAFLENEIDISFLADGIYFVYITYENKLQIEKLIKQ